MGKIPGILVAFAAATMFCAAPARADPDPVPAGCQTDRVGLLGTQFRTICDEPKASDGSWQRTRKIIMPGQRALAMTSVYTVTPETIPDGEPGHIE